MVQGINGGGNAINQVPEIKTKNTQPASGEQTGSVAFGSSSDDGQVQYDIQDNSAEINEAKELYKQMEAEGMKLKDIVTTFTNASNQSIGMMSNILTDVSQYMQTVEQNNSQAMQLTEQAAQEQQQIDTMAKEAEAQIKEKEAQITNLNEKIESGEATEEEAAQAQELSDEIANIANKSASDIEAKTNLANDMNSQIAGINADSDNIASSIENAINNAGNAIELADQTAEVSGQLMEKGNKLKTLFTVIGGMFGGMAGAILGNTLGGRDSIAKATEGLQSAGQLNTVATMTTGMSAMVAEQNGMTIQYSANTEQSIAGLLNRLGAGSAEVAGMQQTAADVAVPTEGDATTGATQTDNPQEGKQPRKPIG